MELQKQCVSLELAKRLEELGVRQESIWEWSGNKSFGFKIKMVDSVRNLLWDKSFFEDLSELAVCRSNYSAFTVGELGEMLPADTIIGMYPYRLDYKKDESSHRWYWNHEIEERRFLFSAETEADCRAKMLIYLIEEDLLTPTPRTNASDGLN